VAGTAEKVAAASEVIVRAMPSLSNVETATVAMTAATVGLAGVAVLVAVVAIAGAGFLIRQASQAGAKAGAKAAQADLKVYLDGPEIRSILDGLVQQHTANYIKDKMLSMLADSPAATADLAPKPMRD